MPTLFVDQYYGILSCRRRIAARNTPLVGWRQDAKDQTMIATRVYALLQEACSALETSEDHAIAAYVGFAMALVEEKYGVGQDHLDTAVCD
ncbi:hypothetical protein ASE88_06780 [Sphingomonas sp. Leaf38]|nr:hypothetical protein ASE88_06780 [Sphingomonas sp. Leaf38]